MKKWLKLKIQDLTDKVSAKLAIGPILTAIFVQHTWIQYPLFALVFCYYVIRFSHQVVELLEKIDQRNASRDLKKILNDRERKKNDRLEAKQ